jgi:hypothetical protein
VTAVSPGGTNGLLNEVTAVRDSIAVFENMNSVLTVSCDMRKTAARGDLAWRIVMTSDECIRKDREEVAERTMAFPFEKPADFQFKARQFVEAELIGPAEMDSQAAVRAFPIANPPYESELLVATRVGNSAFKRALAVLLFSTELISADGIGITSFSFDSP